MGRFKDRFYLDPNAMPTTPSARQVALPAQALTLLLAPRGSASSPLDAIHDAQEAGYGAGEFVVAELLEETGTGDPSRISRDRFWPVLSSFFRQRGWGEISHERVHPGMGLLSSSNWVEAEGPGPEGCAFTTGLLARILGELAEGPIAVVEVTCRSRGDDACRFLFGHEAAVHASYGLLLEGESLDQALARI